MPINLPETEDQWEFKEDYYGERKEWSNLCTNPSKNELGFKRKTTENRQNPKENNHPQRNLRSRVHIQTNNQRLEEDPG